MRAFKPIPPQLSRRQQFSQTGLFQKRYYIIGFNSLKSQPHLCGPQRTSSTGCERVPNILDGNDFNGFVFFKVLNGSVLKNSSVRFWFFRFILALRAPDAQLDLHNQDGDQNNQRGAHAFCRVHGYQTWLGRRFR